MHKITIRLIGGPKHGEIHIMPYAGEYVRFPIVKPISTPPRNESIEPDEINVQIATYALEPALDYKDYFIGRFQEQ